MRDLFRRRRGAPGAAEQSSVVLSDRQHELVDEELSILTRLAVLLDDYPATEEDRRQIADAKEQLTSLFMLVVVGEFNAGKSAFINALIGGQILPEGVTPTTAVINILTYGERIGDRRLGDGSIERTYPAPFLIDITVVDTPGTNAIIREHEALTQKFVPRSDIVFFVTSADRPFTESEREFMEGVKDWGKKIVVVINKIDLLRDQASVKQVIEFVDTNISRLLGIAPEIFPVSALQAQQANELADRNLTESQRLWEESRFGNLQNYIFETLDEEGRIRLKLLSPLGTAQHLADVYLKTTNERLAVLTEDIDTLRTIDRQLELYQEDMRKQFAYHLDRIENIIGKMNARGDDFFEDTIRIGRVIDLMNKDKIKAEFERKVVGDTEEEIDATVNELIDWMVEQDLRTWEAINGYLDRRRLAQYEDQMVGEVSSQFRYDRRALLDSVSKRAQEEVDRYDPDKSANDLSLSVRNAVAQTAIAEVGAIGLGALVVAAASTVAVDVTGIVAASLLAGLGLFILPRKRKQTREEFRKRSTELEQNLISVMNEQFEHELQRSVNRMESAIAPYSRFVRDQHAKLTMTRGELEQIVADLKGMRFKIGGPDDAAPALQAGLRPWSPDEEPKPDYRVGRSVSERDAEIAAPSSDTASGTRGLFRASQ
ncbi:MAG: dynamin family protein [Thermomicrobiales bacterium]